MSEDSTNICIINARCGIGTASPQISQFSHNCSEIKFVIDKDLSDCAVVIITSAEGSINAITEGESLIKSYSEESGETTLLWYPQSEITAQSGCVIYQIAAYSTDDESKFIWYSKEGRLIVNDSIDTTDLSTQLVGSSPNLVMQILTLVKSVELNLEKAENDIQENKEKIIANEENIALNVSNISAIGEDLGSYKNEIHPGEEKYNPQSLLAQSGKAVAEAVDTIMTLLGGKVDKVEGKGLSQNDFTDVYVSMVTNADTMVMQHDDSIRIVTDNLAEHKLDKENPHSVTKEQVGLGNVDNTSDMDKPVSTAVQRELDDNRENIDTLSGNLVQEITGGETSDKYPSANAVYSFVNSAIGEALEADY